MDFLFKDVNASRFSLGVGKHRFGQILCLDGPVFSQRSNHRKARYAEQVLTQKLAEPKCSALSQNEATYTLLPSGLTAGL